MLVFYAELRGGKATWWVNLLSVNEDFEGKRNTEIYFLVPPTANNVFLFLFDPWFCVHVFYGLHGTFRPVWQ